MTRAFFRVISCLLAIVAVSVAQQPALAATGMELQIHTTALTSAVPFDGPIQRWLMQKPSIRVAIWGRARPPLHMGLEPGSLEGVTADVLGTLQQAMQVPFQILHFRGRGEAIQALERGEVDMLGLSDTSEPSDPRLLPSNAYLLNRRVIIRRLSDLEKSPEDLRGQRLAYIDSSHRFKEKLQDYYPAATLVRYSNHLNALAALAYNQVDALRTHNVTAQYLMSHFFRNELYVAGDASPTGQADINFSVSAHHPELLKAVNQILAAIPQAEMLRITSRWGLNSDVVMANKPLNLSPEQRAWLASHPVVRIMVGSADAPLTFFDEQNRLQGLAADLLKLIERCTGLTFEIVRSQGVEDMTRRLSAQQADLMAATNISDLRLDPSQYTRPYLVSPFVVVTRRAEADIRDLDELRGMRLALVRGNPLSSWLARHHPEVNIIYVESATRGLELLIEGAVEGAVQTQLGADYFISQHFQSDLHIASVIGERPARVAMAVAPKNLILKDIINAALLTVPPEEVKALTDRWRNHEAPAVASSWSTYKYTVYAVIAIAALFGIVFVAWNYYLRTQVQMRRKAERELQDQLKFSRTLMDGAPVALYVRDQYGHLIDCNQAYLAFLKAARSDLVGRTLLQNMQLPKNFCVELHAVQMAVICSGQPDSADLSIEVYGQHYHLYHWVLPFRNTAGQIIGVIGGWVDITEREQLLEQLHQATEAAIEANHSKSVFLASMSHEIRTPLSALIGLIELLRKRSGTEVQQAENLEIAHQSAQSLLSLIGDALDLSKVEAGAMAVSLRPTHLGELMQSVHRLFEVSAKKKNLDYQLQLDIEHQGVMVDALMLNQIVSNLLSNAIKFTDAGSVGLVVRELPSAVPPGYSEYEVRISDTGTGLTPDEQRKIFEPFVQVGAAHRTGGTGLGLSICRSLAQLLGVHLALDSTPGAGSQFTLRFKAALTQLEAGSAESQAEQRSFHQLKVLVVEDHAPNRLLLCQQLEYLGHCAVPCDGGESALALWSQADFSFDLTITDCNMPGMDGYALSRNMRDLEYEYGIRPHAIFGLTASAQAEIVDLCLDAGMDRCLFKPLSIENLSPLVAELARQSQRQADAALCSNELQKIRLLRPEAYETLLEELLNSIDRDAGALAAIVEEGADPEQLNRVAHRIKGGAQLAGEQALIMACNELEDATRHQVSQEYSREVGAVLACLRTLERRLRQ